MSLVLHIHFFNKLRRGLGIPDALRTYYALRISSSGVLNLSFLKHPIRLRIANRADMETFNEVLLRKAYDIPLSFTPAIIVDAGANIGMTSAFFASKYYGASIIAVEPATHNFELLQENTARYENISCLQAALWHEDTKLQLTDPGRGDNSLQVKASDGGDVQAISVNSIIQQYNLSHIDVLKIDIEGAEAALFSTGYETWLPNVKVLIIELHEKIKPGVSEQVFAVMKQYGFVHSSQGANDVFVKKLLYGNSRLL